MYAFCTSHKGLGAQVGHRLTDNADLSLHLTLKNDETSTVLKRHLRQKKHQKLIVFQKLSRLWAEKNERTLFQIGFFFRLAD